jgi:hypothetical protein
MRLFRSVPSSDFACSPPFPPSAQSLALFPSLSIDRSIHPSAPQARSFPRRRQARSFPPSFLPFLPFPSLLALALVCAVRGPGPGPGQARDLEGFQQGQIFFPPLQKWTGKICFICLELLDVQPVSGGVEIYLLCVSMCRRCLCVCVCVCVCVFM